MGRRERPRKNLRVWLVVMLLLLVSCGSKKKVTDTSIDQRLKESIERMIDESLDKRMVGILTSDLIADITITKKEYDTSKVVGPEGEAPVRSQTDTRVVISRRDSLAVSDTTVVRKRTEETSQTDSENKIENKTEDGKKESRWPVAIIFLSLLGIAIIVFMVIRKFEKKLNG